MRIKELFATKKPVISFEIFPPKKDTPIDTIYNTIHALKDLRPDYISVTFGALGSTTKRTVEIASLIKQEYGIEALAHLTCITSTKNEIANILRELKEKGIDNVLALRGDLPPEPGFELSNSLNYQYAKDLIGELHQNWDFSVGAACYPEGHPECQDLSTDIEYLKEKVEAGTEFLITQLFFDNEAFYHFMDRITKKGINIPVTAGIMPVLNKNQIERIMTFCRASLPPKFVRILEKYEHHPEALKEAGIVYATEQIVDLLSWGVDGIHLYTMNRPEVAQNIVNNISNILNHVRKN